MYCLDGIDKRQGGQAMYWWTGQAQADFQQYGMTSRKERIEFRQEVGSRTATTADKMDSCRRRNDTEKTRRHGTQHILRITRNIPTTHFYLFSQYISRITQNVPLIIRNKLCIIFSLSFPPSLVI